MNVRFPPLPDIRCRAGVNGDYRSLQEVIISLDALEASLRRADSRARGFMFNHEDAYLVGLDTDLVEAGTLERGHVFKSIICYTAVTTPSDANVKLSDRLP